MKYLALVAFIFAAHAHAQCFGPACIPPLPEAGPSQLCLPEGCSVVIYSQVNHFTVAESMLPNGYPVMGWSGPCLQPVCGDIRNQAYQDLELNAKRANRAQRY